MFDTGFGFDGLNALVEETNPVIARERVRVAVIQVLRRDPRVRRIVDLQLDDAARRDDVARRARCGRARRLRDRSRGEQVARSPIAGVIACLTAHERPSCWASTRAAPPDGRRRLRRDRRRLRARSRSRACCAEKLALARELFGDDVDLGSGSALRKLLEISALEDARTWSALAAVYDDSFVATRDRRRASRGWATSWGSSARTWRRRAVTLRLQGTLPPGDVVAADRTRRAHAAPPAATTRRTDEAGRALRRRSASTTCAVVAFYPGPEHNLDPAAPGQQLERWNLAARGARRPRRRAAGRRGVDVTIDALAAAHRRRAALAGRALPRAAAARAALDLDSRRRPDRRVARRRACARCRCATPGAGSTSTSRCSAPPRQDFVERLFSEDEEAASPYRVLVVVAPTAAAIWEGADGLRASVRGAIEDVRPVGIFPRVEEADQVGVGVSADVWAAASRFGARVAEHRSTPRRRRAR